MDSIKENSKRKRIEMFILWRLSEFKFEFAWIYSETDLFVLLFVVYANYANFPDSKKNIFLQEIMLQSLLFFLMEFLIGQYPSVNYRQRLSEILNM